MVDESHDLVKAPSAATDGRASETQGIRWFGIQLSGAPDLSSNRVLFLAAVAVWLLVCALLLLKVKGVMGVGDTDDATRLIIVRDLLAGRGWYDQVIPRFHPPQGAWLHWSRLLDGGIAGLILALRQFLSPAQAEYWGRFFWPMIWILPTIVGGLATGRNLGGRSAVLLTAVLLLVDLQAYRQFIPGRIDHHNIQMMTAVVALACATARKDRTPWAAVGGSAAALGLAIGLEALPLQALIGASYGLALARDRTARGPAVAYGLALAIGAAVLFGIQTPPWRWSMMFCDAIAPNLVAGIAVAGLGLAAVAAGASRMSDRLRLASLLGVGALAAGVYLGLDPRCIHGPFADMNPAVRPFWFNRIQEVQPLPNLMGLERGSAIVTCIMLATSLASAAFLFARERDAPSTSMILICSAVVLAAVTAFFAWRMQDYLFWTGLPAMGAAMSYLAVRRWRDLLLPGVVAALAISPNLSGAVTIGLISLLPTPKSGWVQSAPRCFATKNFAQLTGLPAGNVLAIQDLGPFIVAQTHHSVVVAPYHRMSNVVLAMHEAFNAPPSQAEERVRALGADYIVDCPPYPLVVDKGSFGDLLRKAPPPPWLEPLSPTKAVFKIYRVRPIAAVR